MIEGENKYFFVEQVHAVIENMLTPAESEKEKKKKIRGIPFLKKWELSNLQLIRKFTLNPKRNLAVANWIPRPKSPLVIKICLKQLTEWYIHPTDQK